MRCVICEDILESQFIREIKNIDTVSVLCCTCFEFIVEAKLKCGDIIVTVERCAKCLNWSCPIGFKARCVAALNIRLTKQQRAAIIIKAAVYREILRKRNKNE